ncbi:MAG TPA: Vms1/Ankzf1 family peptidyl-tRNA hydrolase, partial [Mycobacteriales bacterium]|nr:Vms1/Ankzf1 family peptidyl-tRNA hydrolase [Mycobacteriales bacterium]
PHLMPYLAQLADEVPHVVVVADRSGADILIADPVGLVAEESVEGSHQHPLHKTSTEEWSTLHFQHRVENAWAENARDVAAEVAHRVRRLGAELVVVAGDERERTLITDGLAKQLPKGVDAVGVDAGGRAAGSSTEALAGAVHEAVLDRVREQRDQALEKLREAVGRHDGAVTDTPAVCEALRRAQVASIVLRDDPASTAMSWVGPEPLQLGLSADEVEALGVDQPVQDRLDAAIVRALVYSDADLVVSPELPPPARQGVAALLRYTDAATPTG